jgi:hypothetical protein
VSYLDGTAALYSLTAQAYCGIGPKKTFECGHNKKWTGFSHQVKMKPTIPSTSTFFFCFIVKIKKSIANFGWGEQKLRNGALYVATDRSLGFATFSPQYMAPRKPRSGSDPVALFVQPDSHRLPVQNLELLWIPAASETASGW